MTTVCFLLALAISGQAKPIKNEMVMAPGTTITATTKSGKMVIMASDDLMRSYTWEGATRSVELLERTERSNGRLGAYYDIPGDHWREHRGITRGILEEAQQNFKSVALAMQWIKKRTGVPHVYQDNGLYVGWGKTLPNRQLNVEVIQILIHGERPTKLAGSSNKAITVAFKALDSVKDRLNRAVRLGNVDEMQRLLGQGGDPDSRNALGSPLLTVAASKGYRRMVEALLQAGANPNIANPDDEGATALLKASDLEIVRMLLAKGADPNVGYTSGSLAGHTPLMSAAMEGDLKWAQLLLDAGAKPDTASKDGETPLHWGVWHSVEFVKLLLDKGAQVDSRNFRGVTPLMHVAGGGTEKSLAQQIAMVKFLISKGANVNAREDLTRTAYFVASYNGDKATMQRIEKSGRLSQLREDGDSVLDCADTKEIRAILVAAGAKSARG